MTVVTTKIVMTSQMTSLWGLDRPPLIRRSDDNEGIILVEDVLENDDALEDIIEEPDVIPEPLGRGMRTRRPPSAPYQASFRNQSYPGSSFLKVPVHHYGRDPNTKGFKKFHKGAVLLNVYAGAGYQAKKNMNEVQGVVNLNLGEEPLPPLTEAQVESHIMGVVFAQQYTLKKGLEKLVIEQQKLPPKSSSKSMIWELINLSV